MKRITTLKATLWCFLVLTLLLNVIAYNHAYKFTHFPEGGYKQKLEDMSLWRKATVVFAGIDNPRPKNTSTPNGEYETVYIQSEELIEGWVVRATEEKGVVILYHGYSGNKSGNIQYGQQFNRLGYTTLLIDFRGSGGSTGNTTTIGFKEAQDVAASYAYASHNFPNQPIVLFGSSMGAVAVMKAIDEYKIEPEKVILECPFGTMKQTVNNRFSAMGLPSFPFADLLMFYGGVQNGFNAFAHNPVDYSRSITVPTLLIYGRKDERVSMNEIESIYRNLPGEKELVVLPESGHDNYLEHSSEVWKASVEEYLQFDGTTTDTAH